MDFAAKALDSMLDDFLIVDRVVRVVEEMRDNLSEIQFLAPPECREKAVFDFLRARSASKEKKAAELRGPGSLPIGADIYNVKWEHCLYPWLQSMEIADSIVSKMATLPLDPTAIGQYAQTLYESPVFVIGRNGGLPEISKLPDLDLLGDPTTGNWLIRGLELLQDISVEALRYCLEIRAAGWSRRRMGAGEQGYMCNLDVNARVGDYIVLLPTNITHILRKTECGSFRIVGQAYVHALEQGIFLHRKYRQEIRIC